jgi:hypothetical protein
MNTKSTFFAFAWLLGLIILAAVAVSPTIAFGYNSILFRVVPALQVVCVAVFGH